MIDMPIAVSNSEPAPHLTSRYSLVSTSAVLKELTNEGYSIVTASGTRSAAPQFAKHLVQLERRENAPEVGGVVPRILLVNSHNGTGSARVVSASWLAAPYAR